MLPILATAIEIAQIWVPGRHAWLIDFLVDARVISWTQNIVLLLMLTAIALQALK